MVTEARDWGRRVLDPDSDSGDKRGQECRLNQDNKPTTLQWEHQLTAQHSGSQTGT